MVAVQFKQCPDCAEQVRAAARICRFCGYSFESGASGSASDRSLDAHRSDDETPPAPAPVDALPVPSEDLFVPEWNQPIPTGEGPLVLETLPPLPPSPKTGPFGFGLGVMLIIAVLAVGFAAYVLVAFPSSAPVATPNPSVSMPAPTADPAEVAAGYQSFSDVVSSGFSGASGLYSQIAGGDTSAATLTGLISSLQTTADTLNSITPTACFSALYTQAVSLDQTVLTDARALADAGPGADTGAIISHLGSDLGSWQTFVNSQLGPRCGT
jgi:hypothetical protein